MARSTTHIVRCDGDGCKHIGEVAELRDTPEGWYQIKQADQKNSLNNSHPFDFCSLRCVGKWASARNKVVAMKEPKSTPAEETILETLRQYGTPLSARDLIDLSGIAQSTVNMLLNKMVERGEVIAQPNVNAKGNEPRNYYVAA